LKACCILNREFKLWFLKLVINVPMRVLDRFLRFPKKPKYPQTKMLMRTYTQMMNVYRLDCMQGIFGTKPDGNFERMLRVSSKILLNIGERDRYYRAWLGLAYVLAMEEYFDQLKAAEPKDLIFEIKRQWLSDLSFLPDRVIESDLEGFLEYVLCNYLGNLDRKHLEYLLDG
jgi:hypothetical protein